MTEIIPMAKGIAKTEAYPNCRRQESARALYYDGNNDADDGTFFQDSLGGYGTAVYRP